MTPHAAFAHNTGMKRLTLPVWFGVIGALAMCVTSLAHDFWVEPSSSRVEVGTPVTAHLRVGMACPGEATLRKQARIERFELVGPGGETVMAGEDGVEPAGRATPTAPGLHAIVYRGKPVEIELAAHEFEAYLREEGLEKIIRARAERSDTSRPGHEVYSRCAKALVAVGEVPADAADKAWGLRYEIVAEGNPLNTDITKEGGGTVVVRVLLDGKPLAGAQVRAMHCGGGTPKRLVKTDRDGKATIAIDAPGRWVLASTEMFEANMHTGADWESLWASLVFEVK